MQAIDHVTEKATDILRSEHVVILGVLGALENVTVAAALLRPEGTANSIWNVISHLTAELRHANAVLDGAAELWIEGETTWPFVTDTSLTSWKQAVIELMETSRALVHRIGQLDDSVLDEPLAPVRATYYVMLHGTIQHNAYHAGQISLLKRQVTSKS